MPCVGKARVGLLVAGRTAGGRRVRHGLGESPDNVEGIHTDVLARELLGSRQIFTVWVPEARVPVFQTFCW